MDFREAAASSIESLRAHALRSGLTMLGIIFGVGAVIAMLSIGAGAEREALEMIDALGMRNILVQAKDYPRENDLVEVRKKSPGILSRDADAIADAVPGVETVIRKVMVEPYKVLSPQGRAKPRVIGVSYDYTRLVRLDVAEGRFLDALDEATFAQVCVIGEGVRRDLFGFGRALGQVLKVNEHWLTVVGVLAASARDREVQGFKISGTANDIYLPVSTAERKFASRPLKSPLDELVVAMNPDAPVQETGAVLSSLLDRLHGGADDYTVVVPEALLAQSRKTQRLFDLVMGCIAGISLLVGGIGIMNIMLATVLERTGEIGVRRALGATRLDIRNQFMIESFLLSVLGGAVGILMGVAIARGVAFYAGWRTIVTLTSILLSTGVSVTVGLAFGLYPAVRAARLDPIESLRHQ